MIPLVSHFDKIEVTVGNSTQKKCSTSYRLKKNPKQNIKICSLIIFPIHLRVDCILKIIFFNCFNSSPYGCVLWSEKQHGMIPLIRSGCTKGWAEAGGCPAIAGWCGAAFILYQFLFPPVPAVGEALSAAMVSLSKETFYVLWRQKCVQGLVLKCWVWDHCGFAKVNGRKTSSPWDSRCRAKITAK